MGIIKLYLIISNRNVNIILGINCFLINYKKMCGSKGIWILNWKSITSFNSVCAIIILMYPLFLQLNWF